jgi:membrane fusion protein, multidrug efflux system
MKKIIIFVMLGLLLFGCQPKQETVIEETVEEIKPISVFAQTMILRDLPEFIKISGTLEGKTDVIMISEVNGKLLKLNKSLGGWINKDEAIGEVDSEIIHIQLEQTEAAVLSAEASYMTASSNLVASENLYDHKTISKAEYENAITAEKGAKAQLDGTLANKRQVEKILENALITAPVSGYISELPISLGNYVSQGTILCRIVNSKTLIIKTGVGESVIKKLRKNQKVLLTSKKNDLEFDGKITGFGVAPMLGSMNYPIEIEVKNNYNLLAGEIVEANILLNLHKNVFVIKQEALVKEFDHSFLYFINSENTVERKQISIIKTIGDQLIVSGLEEGEKIVATGIENVEEGSLVTIRKEIEE